MAFEKNYPNRKDYRAQYRDRARACSTSCRSHGDCPWCAGNRMHAQRKADAKAREDLRAVEAERAA